MYQRFTLIIVLICNYALYERSYEWPTILEQVLASVFTFILLNFRIDPRVLALASIALRTSVEYSCNGVPICDRFFTPATEPLLLIPIMWMQLQDVSIGIAMLSRILTLVPFAGFLLPAEYRVVYTLVQLLCLILTPTTIPLHGTLTNIPKYSLLVFATALLAVMDRVFMNAESLLLAIVLYCIMSPLVEMADAGVLTLIGVTCMPFLMMLTWIDSSIAFNVATLLYVVAKLLFVGSVFTTLRDSLQARHVFVLAYVACMYATQLLVPNMVFEKHIFEIILGAISILLVIISQLLNYAFKESFAFIELNDVETT